MHHVPSSMDHIAGRDLRGNPSYATYGPATSMDQHWRQFHVCSYPHSLFAGPGSLGAQLIWACLIPEMHS